MKDLFDIDVDADLRKGRHYIGLLYIDGELYSKYFDLPEPTDSSRRAEDVIQQAANGAKRVLRGDFGDD